MSLYIKRGNHSIEREVRTSISERFKRITKSVNIEFWNSSSEINHSIYVGSYGRGTAINTSDLDVLVELPNEEYEHFTNLKGNGQSRLLQVVKEAVQDTYPNTDIKRDGQVVVICFSDKMKFEILPAFKRVDWIGNWDGTYIYPDTHKGGEWKSTNPKDEQNAMKIKDNYENANGLLKDTCKHIRYIKNEHFKSYHLSGILIDSFVYMAIGGWHWLREGEKSSGLATGTYEQRLLDYYNDLSYQTYCKTSIYAPGSRMKIDIDDWEVLGKVLSKMV